MLVLALTILSCNFRNPDDGYDPDWEPDHSTTQESSNTPHSVNKDATATGSLPDETEAATYKRPSEIAADTNTMQATTGKWSEMNESVKTNYTVYRENGKLAMILETTGTSTRNYYYNDGTLFYYNESANDGSWELTVEFDEMGDVRGSHKQTNGERGRVDRDQLSEIVEHAVELRLASEEDDGF